MSNPISIVCWKWKPTKDMPNTKTKSSFTSAHVNALYRMVRKHTTVPLRFICVTDDKRGINSAIETITLWNEFRDLGGCFTRLVCFKRDFDLFGDKFLSIDLDCIITGNIDHILSRDEDFIMWSPDECDLSRRVVKYCGSMWLLKVGSHPEVYESFDPAVVSEHRRKNVYMGGSDQRQISNCVKGIPTFGRKDGVYNFIPDMAMDKSLPDKATILFFNGPYLPDDPGLLVVSPWIKDHYSLAGKGILNYHYMKVARKLNSVLQNKTGKVNNEKVDITFILYWWGDWPKENKGAGPAYIKRLVSGIKRHTDKRYKKRIVLFTDKNRFKFPGLDVQPLSRKKLRWNLRKMWMFSQKANITSPAICIDLDAIIVGDLNPLIKQVINMPKQTRLYTCSGAYNPKLMGGSVVAFKPNYTLTRVLWEPLLTDELATIEKETKGSERKYYQYKLKQKNVQFWNDLLPGAVLSYKKECRKSLPEGALIVRFHGNPRPHQVTTPWVKEYWR